MVKTSRETKTCTMCKEVKSLDDFERFRRNNKSGVVKYYRSRCRDCRRQHRNLPCQKQAASEYQRKYRMRKSSRPRKKFSIATYEEHRKKHTEYMREKRRNNLRFRVVHNLRNRLYKALKGKSKTQKTLELVGCSSEQMIEWIERQFKDGMTWENIHIDHMMPCAAFKDLGVLEQQKRCFHFTNLQPMFSSSNMSKGAKILYDMKWCDGEWSIMTENGYTPRKSLIMCCANEESLP